MAGFFPIHTGGQPNVFLLTYLQFSVIKWAKQRPGQNQLTLSLMKQFRSNRLTLH